MPKFIYIARDKAGKKITGTEEGVGQEEVISRLQARDLLVINVMPDDNKEGSAAMQPVTTVKTRFRPKHYRITSDDLVLFCRQLSTLLSAGVTILKSLEIISQQISSRKLLNIIKTLNKNMEAGLSFHEAMAKHRDVFSELWVSLVDSGEASGNLAVVLTRLATYLERNMAFRRKVISTMIYPGILMLAGFGALLFLTLKIIPTFAGLFTSFDITLPLLTRMLISISGFIRNYLMMMAGLIILGFFAFRRYIKTKKGRRIYENFLFRLPIVGEFFRALVVERFSSEMSTLVESGVPILYSLEISERSVGNLVMADVIRKVKENVREGKPLSQPLAQSGFFEPMVVQMVNIGEEIGELSQMFKKINVFYQDYAETFLVRFIAMFEPLILVLMGIVIGIMVVGMFMPIFQISQLGIR